ncbi:MAG: hypothetical protein AABM31_11860 [Actinomycetota bacterium]
MKLQAIALLVAVAAIPPAAYAVDPERGGGAAIPPSGGATAPDPTAPDPTEPTAPPLVRLDGPPVPVGGAEIEEPAPPANKPKVRAAQDDGGYTEVQVPMPGAEADPDDSGSTTLGGSGLANTGLELSLVLAAGMSMLGAGLLVLGLVRRPR